MTDLMIYDYYVYSNSIARVDKNTNEVEIKKQSPETWEKVTSAAVWKRIVQEGDPVSKELAERIYSIIHR